MGVMEPVRFDKGFDVSLDSNKGLAQLALL